MSRTTATVLQQVRCGWANSRLEEGQQTTTAQEDVLLSEAPRSSSVCVVLIPKIEWLPGKTVVVQRGYTAKA